MIMKYTILFTALLSVTGCAGIGGSDKPTRPSGSDARASCAVQSGTVLEVIDVTLEGPRAESQAIGAAIGGYAGSVATRGGGDLARLGGSVAGAAAGAVVGGTVNDLALTRPGTELVIAVSGSTVSIVQETDRRAEFQPGDQVWVIGLNEQYRHRNTRCDSGVRVLPQGKP